MQVDIPVPWIMEELRFVEDFEGPNYLWDTSNFLKDLLKILSNPNHSSDKESVSHD